MHFIIFAIQSNICCFIAFYNSLDFATLVCMLRSLACSLHVFLSIFFRPDVVKTLSKLDKLWNKRILSEQRRYRGNNIVITKLDLIWCDEIVNLNWTSSQYSRLKFTRKNPHRRITLLPIFFYEIMNILRACDIQTWTHTALSLCEASEQVGAHCFITLKHMLKIDFHRWWGATYMHNTNDTWALFQHCMVVVRATPCCEVNVQHFIINEFSYPKGDSFNILPKSSWVSVCLKNQLLTYRISFAYSEMRTRNSVSATGEPLLSPSS